MNRGIIPTSPGGYIPLFKTQGQHKKFQKLLPSPGALVPDKQARFFHSSPSANVVYLGGMQPLEISLPPVPVLAGLSAAALQLLSSESRRHSLPAGAVVVKEGESGNTLFLVETGSVRVFKLCEDREVELAVLGPGSCFGESCILTTLPRMATVGTLTDAILFSVSSMAFYHLYKTMPEQYSILVLNIARELARRLRALDEQFAACH